MNPPADSEEDLIPTRRSLLTRLKHWDDQEGWNRFFDTYWRLIYGVTRKAGLSDADAQEVVQETVLNVAKGMKAFKTGREHGSFKAWLLTIVRRRIADHFREQSRKPPAADSLKDDSTGTDKIERMADPDGPELETIWNDEWERHRTESAIRRLQTKVSAKQFQVFQMLVSREMSPAEVAKVLGVSLTTVYVTKHRLSKQLRKELTGIDRGAAD